MTSPGLLAAGLALAVPLAAPHQVARAEDPSRTDSNLATWSKFQVTDFFGGNKAAGWSVDFIVRRQSGHDDHSLLKQPLRESVRPWFLVQLGPTDRLSLSPMSMHIEHGLRATEELADGSYRFELRSTVEYDSAVFLHDRIMLNHRHRLEFRHFDPGSEDHRFLVRLRLRLRARISLNNKNFYDDRVVYSAIYNETAVQYGKTAPFAYNQNRAFFGVGHRFEKYVRAELGYVNQWAARGGRNEYLQSHGPMVYLLMDYLSAFDAQGRIRRLRTRRDPHDIPWADEVFPSLDELEPLEGFEPIDRLTRPPEDPPPEPD